MLEFIHTWLPLLFIVGVGFGLLTLARPFLLAIGLVFAVSLSPELPLGLPLRIEDFVIAWGLVVLVLRSKSGPPLAVPHLKPFLALLGVELVATLLGVVQGTARLDLSVYSGAIFLAKSIEVFLLYVLVVRLLDTPDKVKTYSWALLCGGAALASVGAFNQLTGRSHIPGVVVDIEGGPTYSLMALALMPPMMLGVALWLAGRARLWAALLLGPIIYAFIFTLSRQAYLGAAAMLSLVLWRYKPRLLIAAAILVVGTLHLFPEIVPEAVAQRASTIVDPFTGQLEYVDYGVYGSRLRAWERHLPDMMTTNPITGMGLAALSPGSLDSQYLVILYYTGFVGLLVFLRLLFLFGKQSWQLYLANPDPLGRALGLAGLGIVIGFAVSSFGGSPFVAVRAREMFWLLMAGVAAYSTMSAADLSSDNKKFKELRIRGKWPAQTSKRKIV